LYLGYLKTIENKNTTYPKSVYTNSLGKIDLYLTQLLFADRFAGLATQTPFVLQLPVVFVEPFTVCGKPEGFRRIFRYPPSPRRLEILSPALALLFSLYAIPG